MSAVTKTLASVVASLFGNSEKALSEKLSTEEFNSFSADAQKASERIETLEGEKKTAEEDRDKYKGWFDGKKDAGEDKPSEDATNKNVTTEGLADYNSGALAHYRKVNGL